MIFIDWNDIEVSRRLNDGDFVTATETDIDPITTEFVLELAPHKDWWKGIQCLDNTDAQIGFIEVQGRGAVSEVLSVRSSDIEVGGKLILWKQKCLASIHRCMCSLILSAKKAKGLFFVGAPIEFSQGLRLDYPLTLMSRVFEVGFSAALVIMFGTGSAHARPGCDVPNPPPACDLPDEPTEPAFGSPKGELSTVTRIPEGIVVTGTAVDPDAPGPVAVAISIIGSGYVGTVWATGTGGTFSETVPAQAGSAVCAVAINRNGGTDTDLGCQTKSVVVNPIGALDAVLSEAAGLRVRGWAVDPDTLAAIEVHIYVNGSFARSVSAGVCCRYGNGAGEPPYGGSHVFETTLPTNLRGRYTVCAYGINVGPGDTNTEYGCRTVTQSGPPHEGIPRALGDELSFQSYPQPGTVVRVTGETLSFGVIDSMTEMDVSDARFRKVSGLSDSNCVSFENIKYPGRYLRHDDRNQVLVQAGGIFAGFSFNADATFCRDGNGLRYESANKGGFFLRDDGVTLVLASNDVFNDPDFMLDTILLEISPATLRLENFGPSSSSEVGPDTVREILGACTGLGPPLTNPPDLSTLRCVGSLLADPTRGISRPESTCAIGLPYAGFYPWLKTTERHGEYIFKIEKGRNFCIF